MSYRGRIKNGVVVFPFPVSLPEGAEVQVEAVASAPSSDNGATPKPWSEVFGDVIGSVEGLPTDFAAQHDHYIHGTPKKP
jgi:hypothetical protein